MAGVRVVPTGKQHSRALLPTVRQSAISLRAHRNHVRVCSWIRRLNQVIPHVYAHVMYTHAYTNFRELQKLINGAEVMSEKGRRLGEEKDGAKVFYAREHTHTYTHVHLFDSETIDDIHVASRISMASRWKNDPPLKHAQVESLGFETIDDVYCRKFKVTQLIEFSGNQQGMVTKYSDMRGCMCLYVCTRVHVHAHTQILSTTHEHMRTKEGKEAAARLSWKSSCGRTMVLAACTGFR